MIGKGKRSNEVIKSMHKNNAVYFAAIGGAGALLSKCIKKAEVIAYDDLGTEAIRKLEVENLPAIVVIDNISNIIRNQTKISAYLANDRFLLILFIIIFFSIRASFMDNFFTFTSLSK